MSEERLTNYVKTSKQQLWHAYKEICDKLDQQEKTLSTTEIAKDAETKVHDVISQRLNPENIKKQLLSTVELLETTKLDYESLVASIKAKKTELKNVHDIEVEANTLMALLELKNNVITEKEEAAQEIISLAEEKATEFIENAKVKRTEIQHELNCRKAEAEKLQERTEEEWQYNFDRRKKLQKDIMEDELTEHKKKMVEEEALMVERERLATEKLGEAKELEIEFENLKNSIEEKVQVAEKEAADRARKSYQISLAMERKDLESQINLKDVQIENLERLVKDLRGRITEQEAQVSNASDKLAQIAQQSLKSGADAATITEVTKLMAQQTNKK